MFWLQTVRLLWFHSGILGAFHPFPSPFSIMPESLEISVEVKWKGKRNIRGPPLKVVHLNRYYAKNGRLIPTAKKGKVKQNSSEITIHCNFTAVFFFFSSLRRRDQSTIFSIVSFDFKWSRSPKIRHPFTLVCRCGLADITRFVHLNRSDRWDRNLPFHFGKPVYCSTSVP